MADVMDGPTLRVGDRVVRTFLFALLDDCSRLVPHAQYYDNERLPSLLDCLKEAFGRRGLPEKLYTDQAKIFTCSWSAPISKSSSSMPGLMLLGAGAKCKRQ